MPEESQVVVVHALGKPADGTVAEVSATFPDTSGGAPAPLAGNIASSPKDARTVEVFGDWAGRSAR